MKRIAGTVAFLFLLVAGSTLRHAAAAATSPSQPADASGSRFIQSGENAVARSLLDKERDVINVRDFGAKCDGTTDDTTALKNAIGALGALGGGELVFPSGRCLISPIVVSNQKAIRLRGAGRFATTILLASPGTALTFSGSQWVTITQMAFAPAGQPQALPNSNGVQFDARSGNGHIDEVNFLGFSKDGLRLVGTVDAPLSGFKVTNCYFLGNGGDQLFSTNSNDLHYENNQFGDLNKVQHPEVGAHLVHSNAGSYTSNLHWSNGIGLKADDSNFNTYSINRFEMSDRQNVYLSGGSYVIFTSNKVHTGSLGGNGTYDNVYVANVNTATIGENLVFSWNSTFTRWGINIDAGCSDVTLSKNKISGFDSKFGPVRIDPSVGNRAAGDFQVQGTTTAAIAPNTTGYLGSNGASPVEAQANFILSRRAAIVRFYVATDVAPGVDQSFSYTLRQNGKATAMTAGSRGASSFTAATENATPEILVKPDDMLSIQVVTSAGSTPANHRYYIEFTDY